MGKVIDWLLSKFSETFKNRIRYSQLNFLWCLYLNARIKHSGTPFFGQNEEDRILSQYLNESDGSYVDVGAGWTIRGSNTYLFYKRGWTGNTIDPIAKNMKLHKIFRRRDIQFQALLGSKHETVRFYRFEPYEYSTSDSRIAEVIRKKGGVRLIAVENLDIKRLDSLRIKANPLEASLLSIDVEGKDFDVLSSNNWSQYLPRVICIETWSDHGEDEAKIQDLLSNNGYKLVSQVSLSKIYVHMKYLQERLIYT